MSDVDKSLLEVRARIEKLGPSIKEAMGERDFAFAFRCLSCGEFAFLPQNEVSRRAMFMVDKLLDSPEGTKGVVSMLCDKCEDSLEPEDTEAIVQKGFEKLINEHRRDVS